jgi:hypothetical protein
MEFYNPTKETIMARIYLNGKAITQGGLVLRPAERVFLERYFDVAKKFQFDTYTVANTQEVKDAIENNGDFKVEFFRESTPPPPHWLNAGCSNSTLTIPQPYYGQYLTNTCSANNTTYARGIVGGNNTSSNISNNLGGAASYTNSIGLTSMNSLSDNSHLDMSFMSKDLSRSFVGKKLKKSKIETGRVEQGSDSTQKIKTINKNFDNWAFHSVQYKLLPISQKVNTSEDVKVTNYCVNCGTKIGKTDRFCAKCGTKI